MKKLFMVDDKPTKYESTNSYVELELWGHNGSVSLSHWDYSTKQEKNKLIRELNTLGAYIDQMVSDIENMEEQR